VLGVPKLTCDKKTKKGKVACDKEIGMPKRRERERERTKWGWALGMVQDTRLSPRVKWRRMGRKLP